MSALRLAVRQRPSAPELAYLVLPVLASLAAAAVVVANQAAATALLVGAGALLLLRNRPVTIWVAALGSSLLLDSFVRTTVVYDAAGMYVYAADLLPIVLLAGAAVPGLRRVAWPGEARLALTCGLILSLLIAVAFFRSASGLGLTPALQARHVAPLFLAVLLPYTRGFANVSSRAVVNAVVVASVAIAVAATLRLVGGYETTSALGVQRIYQTWEPFIAATLFLILLAFCLVGTRVGPQHYVGLAASTIPVVFSFFRVAWVLSATLALVMLLLARGRRGRAWVVIGLGVASMALVGVGAIGTHGETSYASQIAKRTNEIRTGLDSYRAQEYRAVWKEIGKNPVVGSGFGTEYEGQWTIFRTWCHNAYEWMWWRLGLVGLVAFLGLLLGAIVAGTRAIPRLAGDDRALAVGLTAALVFLAAAANFHENFENYQSNLVNGLLIAQILVLRARAGAREER